MSYLVVNKWQGDKLTSQAPQLQDLIRLVKCQGKKARDLGVKYQAELNHGKTMENCVINNLEWYTVTAIPENQAREYNNFLSWENAPIYKP